MPHPQRLEPLPLRYPLPCTNHAALLQQAASIINDLKKTYDFSYAADPTQPKAKTPLTIYGGYNNHQDLPRVEIKLRDCTRNKDLVLPIAVMVYRGTQNPDDPTYTFRPIQDASSSMQDYIINVLKSKYGVTCKRARLWDTPVSATPPAVNPNLPSVTGNGTVGGSVGGSGGSTSGGVVTGPVVTPDLLATFDENSFALTHSLAIGVPPTCVDGMPSTPCDGSNGTCPNPQPPSNDGDGDCGAPMVYDDECVSALHQSLVNFVDVLNYAAEAEIVSVSPRFMIGTQYCVEDVLSDARAGLIRGGLMTVLFQPIWAKKRYDLHTLMTLYTSTQAKIATNPPADELESLQTQLAAITTLLGTPTGPNGSFVGGSVSETEYLFLDMKDPLPVDQSSCQILPIHGATCDEVAPGSTTLTTGVPIYLPQMFAFAGTFEYSPETNRFKCRRVKTYHNESDPLVQQKLFVLQQEILAALLDNTNDSIVADNRSTTMCA